MKASSVAIATSANSLALSTMSTFLIATSCRTIGFQAFGPVTNQKRPISVCAALRLLFARLPKLLISSTSFAQVAEVNGGGDPGRNCDSDVIDHGMTPP